MPKSRGDDHHQQAQERRGVGEREGWPDGAELSINGQRGIYNNVMIDGADANNPFFGEQRGGQRPKYIVSLEAVKEFQVVTDGASAEFGDRPAAS